MAINNFNFNRLAKQMMNKPGSSTRGPRGDQKAEQPSRGRLAGVSKKVISVKLGKAFAALAQAEPEEVEQKPQQSRGDGGEAGDAGESKRPKKGPEKSPARNESFSDHAEDIRAEQREEAKENREERKEAKEQAVERREALKEKAEVASELRAERLEDAKELEEKEELEDLDLEDLDLDVDMDEVLEELDLDPDDDDGHRRPEWEEEEEEEEEELAEVDGASKVSTSKFAEVKNVRILAGVQQTERVLDIGLSIPAGPRGSRTGVEGSKHIKVSRDVAVSSKSPAEVTTTVRARQTSEPAPLPRAELSAPKVEVVEAKPKTQTETETETKTPAAGKEAAPDKKSGVVSRLPDHLANRARNWMSDEEETSVKPEKTGLTLSAERLETPAPSSADYSPPPQRDREDRAQSQNGRKPRDSRSQDARHPGPAVFLGRAS